MQELNQGEEYEEYGFEDEELQYEDEANAETSSDNGDTIFGVPKNIFFIGAAGLLVLIIFIIVIAVWRGRDKDNGALSGYDEYAPPADDYYAGDTTGDVYTGDDTYSTTGGTDVYDATGVMLGTADSLDEGSLVIGSDDTVIGIISATGEPVYDNSGNVIGNYMSSADASSSADNNNDSTLEQSDVVLKLRKLGYTGDEIETAMNNGLDLNALVEEGEKLQDEAAKEALKRMSDSASPEFQTLVNNSIYCMPLTTFTASPYGEVTSVNLSDQYVVNADYEKLPTYGMQLFLKCKIANGTFLFMTVTPDRWETLPEAGNIVLQVSYTIYGTNDSTSVYVTNVEEINATQITVNPQDSGSSMEDILNQGVLGEMMKQQAEEAIDDAGDYYIE